MWMIVIYVYDKSNKLLDKFRMEEIVSDLSVYSYGFLKDCLLEDNPDLKFLVSRVLIKYERIN